MIRSGDNFVILSRVPDARQEQLGLRDRRDRKTLPRQQADHAEHGEPEGAPFNLLGVEDQDDARAFVVLGACPAEGAWHRAFRLRPAHHVLTSQWP